MRIEEQIAECWIVPYGMLAEREHRDGQDRVRSEEQGRGVWLAECGCVVERSRLGG